MKAIDLFAGWGGFTCGAESAGAEVVYAANHWPLAVQAHQLNHPKTQHECQDLRQADWSRLPEYDLMLASPACQGHSQAAQPSRARSDRQRRYHDALRSTAWAVVDCADITGPSGIIVENVPDFLRWRLYPVWKSALEKLGYEIQERVISATDHGVPQRRSRVFVVATRGAAPSLDFEHVKEPAFGPCIDWDEGKWRPLSKATPRVAERVAAGRARHGDRFLTQHVTGHKGVPLHESIRTITTKDQWAVVDHQQYRPLTVRESARAMGFPDEYGWPEGSTRRDRVRGLGNAVCPPVAAALVGRMGDVI
jgi:DNA (cytosine-5)-methyltransferase 1